MCACVPINCIFALNSDIHISRVRFYCWCSVCFSLTCHGNTNKMCESYILESLAERQSNSNSSSSVYQRQFWDLLIACRRLVEHAHTQTNCAAAWLRHRGGAGGGLFIFMLYACACLSAAGLYVCVCVSLCWAARVCYIYIHPAHTRCYKCLCVCAYNSFVHTIYCRAHAVGWVIVLLWLPAERTSAQPQQ